jgi:hypothetical protein
VHRIIAKYLLDERLFRVQVVNKSISLSFELTHHNVLIFLWRLLRDIKQLVMHQSFLRNFLRCGFRYPCWLECLPSLALVIWIHVKFDIGSLVSLRYTLRQRNNYLFLVIIKDGISSVVCNHWRFLLGHIKDHLKHISILMYRRIRLFSLLTV